jgi:uncharacterized protein with FMN-binding domain
MGLHIMTTTRLRTVRAALAGFAVIGALTACTAQQASPASSAATTSADTSAATSADSSADSSAAAVTEPSTAASEQQVDSSSSAADSAAPSSAAGSAASSAAASSAKYKDGSYSAEGTYQSPGGQEKVKVDLTIADDKVTAVTVTPESGNATGQQYEGMFASGISAEVVGKDIDSLNVGKVSGSSLTSGGFNAAVETIKKDAANS